MTRGDVLLVTAGWCLLLIWVVGHWWRLLSEQRDLVNRIRPPQVRSTPRRLRRTLDRLVRRTWVSALVLLPAMAILVLAVFLGSISFGGR